MSEPETIGELKPCPFCGDKLAHIWSPAHGGYSVICGNGCGAEGAVMENEERAAEAWNQRLRDGRGAKEARSPLSAREDLERGAGAWLSDSERCLRKMLAFAYGGPNLYGDDGELQDSRMPFPIDYMRDSIEQIETAIYNRGMAKLSAPPAQEAQAEEEREWCIEQVEAMLERRAPDLPPRLAIDDVWKMLLRELRAPRAVLTEEQREALEAGALALDCEGMRIRSGTGSPPESIPKSDKAQNSRWVEIKSKKIHGQVATLRNLATKGRL